MSDNNNGNPTEQEISQAFHKILSQAKAKAEQVKESECTSSLPPQATPQEARTVLQAIKAGKVTPQSNLAFQKILAHAKAKADQVE